MFAGREKIRDRHKRGLYLSAARAHLFNRVLSQRVAERTWNQPLAGDVMMLEGSHSVFPVACPDADIRRRAMALDLHPTGPLWGRGSLTTQAAVEALERRIAEEDAVLSRGLEQAGLRLERRALRVTVSGVGLEHLGPGAVAMGFELPAGAYATSVLRELVVL
jgi:tRNA pseudouridine13 synthase